MAVDKKITELTELTLPVSGDLIHIVDDPDTTATNKKITIDRVLNRQLTSAESAAGLTNADIDIRYDPGNVLRYGAVGDGVTDDTAAIQAAIDQAEAGGSSVRLLAGTYKITSRLLVDAAGVVIFGSGYNCIIRQDTWGVQGLEVRADDPFISAIRVQTTQTKAVISSTPFVDGFSARGQSAGIYVANSDRYRLDNIHADGFVIGIVLRGETADSTLSEDGVVNNFQGVNLDQGILFAQQRGLHIDGVQTQDTAISQTGDPCHTIYHFGAPIGSEVHSEDCNIVNIHSRDAVDEGAMVQLKFVKGFTGGNWTARNTRGVLLLEENVLDFNVVNINGYEQRDVTVDNVALMHVSGTTNRRIRISKFHLECAVDDVVYLNALNASGTNDDIIFEDGIIVDSSATNTAVANLRGDRNIMRRIQITCLGTARKGFILSKDADDTSTGLRVEDISGLNTAGSSFVDIQGGSTDAIISLDVPKLDLQVFNATLIDDGGTTTVVNLQNQETLTFQTGDATPFVNIGVNFETFAGIQTITAFDGGYKNQIIRVKSKAAITYDTTTANDATHNLDGSSVDLITADGDVTIWQFDGSSWTLLGFVDISADNSGGA